MFPKVYRAPADVFDGTGLVDPVGLGQLFVQASADDVVLPEGVDIASAGFARAGPDLMITAADGTEVVVADFFMQELPPALVDGSGARLRGDLVERLAGSMTPGQVAGELPESSEEIGRVVNLGGEVTAVRADGTRVTLNVGDPVYQGDILDTADGSGLGIVLADGTSLSMGDDARMVLDEMVYDPGNQDGSISLSVMKGIFTMVSGEVSKTDPDAMQVHTPTATIGIRGTQIGLDLSNGRDLTLVLMAEADGFVGEVTVTNAGGVLTLNEAYHAVTVSAFDIAPTPAPTYSIEHVTTSFGSALSYLPTDNNNANDYGLQSMSSEDLVDFETAAGPADIEDLEDDMMAGLATFEDVEADTADAVVPGAENVEIQGLADFELAVDENPEGETEGVAADEFVTAADQSLNADQLATQADVVFGEEIEPLTPTGTVLPEDSDPLVGAQDAADDVTAHADDDEIPPTSIFDLEDDDDIESVAVTEEPNTAPVVEPGSAILAEENAYSGQLSASDLEGGELTFSLADDGEAEHGIISINPDGSFTYTPDPDYGGSDSFSYMVTDEDGATATATVTLSVTPVADVPQLAVADATGFEDSAIALTMAASMPSGTTETISSITISGVPSGAVLSAGTDNGDGSWTLSGDQLSGLTMTPPRDAFGTYDLNVSVSSSDGSQASGAFALEVRSVADVPQLAVADVTGTEDGSVALTIAAAMSSNTGETIESILLTGLPVGTDLSAGTDNGDGTWTLLQSELAGLTLTPPTDFNGVFNIGVSVISTDGSIAADDFAVNVTPSADTPIIATTDVTGTEDSAISLTLATSMPAGTGETVETITVANVPDGAMLSRGTDNGDGTWTLTPDQLFGLTLTPPTDYNGTFDITVVATSSDGSTASSALGVTVEPLADIPQLAVIDAVGVEDGSIALTLAASMPSGTTEALYTITIDGIPDGASLSAGLDNGDGSWTLTPDLMNGLTLTPPPDYNGVLDLTVYATSTDGGTAMASMGVTVTPVGDTPTLAVTDASGAEDSSIALTIAAAMPGGTTETIDTITISGVPDGAVLSAGTDNGDGTWTLSPAELSGLSLTPPMDYNGTFDLSVSVTSTDGAVATSPMGVTIGAVADVPIIAAGNVSGGEDQAINLTLAAAMPAGTTETLNSVVISGVPEGATLNGGTDNGDGTWTLTPEQLTGLSLTPPTNYSGTLALTIRAVSTDGGTSTSDFNVSVAPVADVPTLQVSDVVVTVSAPPGQDIEGTKHADELYGTMGDDTIAGDSGHDVIYGDSDEAGGGDLSEAVVVPLDVDAALSDIDGSEMLSIEISGVPDGASLSYGTDNGDGSWTLAADDLSHLDDLNMTLAEGTPQDDFDLSVVASSSELQGGDVAATTATINVAFASDSGDGADIIDGGKGSDTIYGGGGDDVITGAEGHDVLYGEAGDDVIDGGKGADTIVGGEGDDVLSGGGNEADTFVFHAGDGDDIILDLGHQDVLRFEGQEFNMDNFILQSDPEGEATTITFGDDAGVSVTLNDVDVDPSGGYSVTQDGDAVVVTFDKDSID